MTRFLKALHYLFNPGGQTNKSKAMRRTKAETHAALRRVVAEQKLRDAMLQQQCARAIEEAIL